MNTVISCREVGAVCTGLIEEGYALKGFRVDTKSCNWGPWPASSAWTRA
jgi:hypothetical protein